jgi:hypothetical protein
MTPAGISGGSARSAGVKPSSTPSGTTVMRARSTPYAATISPAENVESVRTCAAACALRR